ncbi:NitT/TauT family transport system permease protein [Xaviernesmea oryzae]|uniref:NitT/TauT family transport system permease protein n=1 Tax=Xaviernesmea oryzae TaxID=464029 RepID=A0A1X7G1S6_9HYPH|nr:ABC transporter permease subunit [Xaviernesmea oryzae]SMF62473.1 NitT/TauT family transport system permease protein [Xaviernesmea oryzae]
MAIMDEKADSRNIVVPHRASGRLAFRLRKSVMDILPTVLFLAALLAIWKVASGYMPPVLIPSPERVAMRFFTMWSTPGFLSYAGMTVLHVLASVAIAFVLGLAISLTVHFLPIFRGAVYRRLAPFLNAFPGVGWAFLALIWLGINSPAVIFASSAAMLPLAIINLGAGLREMNAEALEMALSFSRSTPRRIRMVMLPLMFPYMFATLRLCFGVSWQIVLVVELLSGAPGLGAVVSVARQRYWTDMIFSVVALILIAVFITDRLIFARLQSRIGKVYNV